jgi:hypothetical protein
MQANKTSILVDASKYIKELKDKVEEAAAASWSQADTDSSSAFGSGSAMPATVRLITLLQHHNPDDDCHLYLQRQFCKQRNICLHVCMYT